MGDKADLLPGTLDLLILKAASLGKMHGYGILLRIEQLSQGALLVEQGALYPALYRLRDRGLIKSDWGASESGRRVKVYALTKKGSAALEVEQAGWRRFSEAVDAILASG